MNINPDALRESARRTRETALRALDAADEDEIRADALDQLINAQPGIIEAHNKLAAAEKTGSVADVTAASFALCDAEIDTWPLGDVVRDPLNLAGFIACPGWLARLERPEVYRRVLLAEAEGRVVPEEAFEAAVAAARRAWKFDAALIGDLEPVGGL